MLVLRVSGALPRPHVLPPVAPQASGKFDREIVPVEVAQTDASGGCWCWCGTVALALLSRQPAVEDEQRRQGGNQALVTQL